jgi:hypothetical protein
MLDSGASSIVLDEAVFASLGQPERPRLDGLTAVTIDGPAATFFSRLWRVRLAGADLAPASISIDDVPVIIHPGSDTLANLSRETGVEVGALAGGMLLRGHLTTIDVPGRTLRMARYHDDAHLPADEWIGVGFTLQRTVAEWHAGHVYTNRDAWSKGLRPDHIIEAIDDVPIRDLPRGAVDALLDPFVLGDLVPVTYRGPEAGGRIEVVVEHLLPSYPPPDSAARSRGTRPARPAGPSTSDGHHAGGWWGPRALWAGARLRQAVAPPGASDRAAPGGSGP